VTATVTTADARAQFSRIANEVHNTGVPVTVFKNSRPWVVIQPVQPHTPTADTLQAMRETEAILAAPARFVGYEDFMAALESADADS
jgi:prevent-host-death family protein